jgi:ubiquinone/menaquinone biosynthesis C-methylase UbiE
MERMESDHDHSAPNHHAHHRGFTGLFGVVAALSMVRGREPDARLAAELTKLQPDDTLVDIGCGPGAAVRYAAGVGATATGVDPASVMLRTARLLSRNGRRVSYVEGTAEALPLPDASASVAWSIATVHHWHDIDAGLREVRRVLQPGGRFVAIEKCTTPDAHGLASHGWTETQAEAFATRMRELGFVDVRVDKHKEGRHRALCAVATNPG